MSIAIFSSQQEKGHLMKLALISDIHGNLFAFDAVLEDIRRRKVEQILCLGDVVTSGPQPRETLARLQEIGCPTVMGNTDAWVIEPELYEYSTLYGQRLQDVEYWSSQQLDAQDKALLKTFQPTIEWPLNEKTTLLAYHGSPQSFLERIYPTTPLEQLDKHFANFPRAQILAGGHVHQQFFLRYRDKIVLNPGSVGQPLDRIRVRTDVEARNPPWAEYAILTIEGDQLGIELLRVPYDIEGFLTLLAQRGMPHTEWLINSWRKV
ncbi:metallophosphoesterase [Ktedonosporobacter rubrisoli]|uniref:Metallophosphoesterase n=1 Tax=Ktedonosporobacter rubrisoli TaxID=2509675 RepID=A0A4P6K6C1_KTERU|nr:metallophosphoesterase family protein [Ktedonosporobacter rubrisoli]QBD83136.1 metallophosphoesterase [Ktedonosporobacter rubrisoli]